MIEDRIGIADYALVLPTNVLATVIIAVRIYLVSRRVNQYIGPDWRRRYTSISAILIESAAPGTILWIIGFVVDIISLNGYQDTKIIWDPAVGLIWSALIVSPCIPILERIRLMTFRGYLVNITSFVDASYRRRHGLG
jgi:hypothetical protein